MPAHRQTGSIARRTTRPIRRYRSGVRPLEDRVTMSAAPWSGLDSDEVTALLAGTNYVQNELVVALKSTAPSFADVLAVESATDAATTAAISDQKLLAAATDTSPALYQLTLDAGADFADTLAAISNWTSVEWVSPNFSYSSAGGPESSSPVLSSIAPQQILEDSSTSSLAFTVSDSDTPLGSIAVTASSSDQTLLANGAVVLTNQGNGDWRLVAAPTANRFGSTTITVTANDGSQTTTTSFVLTVTAVNDAPSFTKGADLTYDSTGFNTVAFGWATNISSGPNETQNLSFVVSNDNPSLFSVQPTINYLGHLQFSSVADVAGTAVVSVRLQDDGGTANGGVDISAVQTFTITLAHPPFIATVADQTINEDGTASVFFAVTDGDTPPESIVITTAVTGFTSTRVLTSLGGGNYRLDITPPANVFGASNITIKASDGIYERWSTFSLTVNSVNDVPVFTKGADVTTTFPGFQIVKGWATGISAGPSESVQTLSFLVTVDDPSLFTVRPSINAAGELMFAAAPGKSGTAHVTVRLSDNGGRAYGGTDVSPPQSFAINVNTPSFASGTLDPHFGVLGSAAASFGTGDDRANDLAVLPDGKFILVGTTYNGFGTGLAVARFNADGSLDTTFGSGGVTTFDLNPPDDYRTLLNRAVVQSDGKIVAVGSYWNSSSPAPLMIRLNADGSRDTSFGAGGIVQLVIGTNAQFNDVVVQADGKIVAFGQSYAQGAIVARFNADGSPDTTFDGDGRVILNLASSYYSYAFSALIQPDGKYVFAGTDIFETSMHVYRLNADGSFDASFGTGGMAVWDPAGDAAAKHVLLQPDGKLVVTGLISPGESFTSSDLAVWRLNSNGTFDTSFGTGGLKTLDTGFTFEAGASAVLLPDGDLIVGGYSNDATSHGLLVRLNGDGTLDTSFGVGGYLRAGYGPGAASISALRLLPDGSLAAAGYTTVDGTSDFLLARYLLAPSVATSPTVTPIADRTIAEDGGTGPILFTVGDSSVPVDSLTVTVTTDNPVLVPPASRVLTNLGGGNYQLAVTPPGNLSGAATVRVTVSNGSTTATSAFLLTVDPVNDVPSFVKGANQSITSTPTAFTVANWATAVSSGGGENQSLTFLVSTDNDALFAVLPSITPAGTLSYTFAPGAYGTAVVSVRLHDDGGTSGGGVDTSAVQTFTISRAAVPTVTPIPDFTIDEDGSTGPIFFTVADADSPLSSLVVSTTSSNSTLVPVSAQVLTDLGGGNYRLVVTPAADQSGTAQITLHVNDGAHERQDTFNVVVNPVNDVPSFVKGADQAVDGSATPRSIAGWATSISPGANETGQTLTFEVEIDNPSLFTAGPAVSSAGALTYTPTGVQGTAVVRVRLKDNGGTASGGVDTSAWQTFTIQVGNFILQAGTLDTTFASGGLFSPGSGATVHTSAGVVVQTDGKILLGGARLEAGVEKTGIWRLNADGTLDAAFGVGGFASHPTAVGSVTNLVLQADGKILIGTTNSNFIFRFNSDGSVDTTFDGDGVTAPDNSFLRLSAIRTQADGKVVASGTFTGSAYGAVYRFNTDGSLDTSFSDDGVAVITLNTAYDEFVNDLAVQADGKIVAVGHISDSFTPDTAILFRLNADGTYDTTFSSDGKVYIQLTENELINSVVLQTDGKILIAGVSVGFPVLADKFLVARYNADGTLDTSFATSGVAMPADGEAEKILLDSQGRILLAGSIGPTGNRRISMTRLLSNGSLDTSFDGDGVMVADPSSGDDDIQDMAFLPDGDVVVVGRAGDLYAAVVRTAAEPAPAPSVIPIADVTTDEDVAATVDFSVSHPTLPASALTVTASSANGALLSAAGLALANLGGGQWQLVATPAANVSGTALVTVTASDGAYSYAESFTVTVNTVNDAPSFVKGADQTHVDVSGPQSVAGWATAISAGPGESQALSFLVSNDNNGLFTVQPTISLDGTLSYTLAAGASGKAVVEVRLHDDGGTDAGGVDTSALQTFTITVAAAPTITPIVDASVGEDTATAPILFSIADADTPLAALSVSASSSDGTLLPPGSFVLTDLGGGGYQLVVTPAADRFGTATITLTVSDGVLSKQTSFKLTVTAVNDAPSFVKGADQTVTRLAGPQTIAGWATALSPGPNETGQNLSFEVFVDNPALFTVAPAVAADGTLSYSLSGMLGTAVVSLRLKDSGGVAGGGVDTSPFQTFTIRVVNTATAAGLDPSFDGDGVRFFDSPIGAYDFARDVARQADGKYVVVGTVGTVEGNSPLTSAIARFNADGTLDATFGTGGIVKPVGNSTWSAVEIAADGKILIAGYKNSDVYLVRLNTDGSFDASFGVNGEVVTATAASDWVSGMALQSDGRIIVVGTSSGFDSMISRYNADGTLDTSFGVGGKVIGIGNPGTDEFYDVAVQADGKIVATGFYDSPSRDFSVVRFNSDGTLDATFDGDGIATVKFAGSDEAHRIVVQADGKIVVAGFSLLGYLAIARFNSDGSLDSSFDGDGRLTSRFTSDTAATALGLQADGKIVVGGYISSSTVPGGRDFLLARYNVDGSLDPTFDGDGSRVVAYGPANDEIAAMVVQADGKIAAVGVSTNAVNGGDFTLARFKSDGSFDTTLDGDGTAVTATGTAVSSLRAAVTVPLAGGKILVGGYASAAWKTGGPWLFWRLNVDGSLDTTFGSGGVVVAPVGFPSDVRSMALQSNGKIVWTSGYGTGQYVGRLNADGSIDASFGTGGTFRPSLVPIVLAVQADDRIIVVSQQSGNIGVRRYTADGVVDVSWAGGATAFADVSGLTDNPRAVAVQADGKIVVGGYGSNGTNDDFAVARFNSDGTLDASFAGDGTTLIPVGTSTDQINTLAVQDDGKIVLGGTSVVGGFAQFTLVRLAADGSLDTSFGGGDGIVTSDVTTGVDTLDVVTIEKSGKILAVGTGGDAGNWNVVLARYRADGVLDAAYDGDGILVTDVAGADDTVLSAALEGDGRLLVAGYELNPSDKRDVAFLLRYLTSAPADAPAVAPLSDVATAEDVAATVDIAVSHPSLPASALAVTATSNNPTLLPAAGLVLTDLGGGNWRLTATPAANLSGTALVTVVASDGSLSYAETFTLTVTSVNDAPSFVKGADQLVPVGAGPQTVAGWAGGISAGPNEPGQTVAFLVSNDNTGLFAVQPAISPGGTLSYTLAPGVIGTAVVSVRLQDDGGTANGGADASAVQTFRITVDAPPAIPSINPQQGPEDSPLVFAFTVDDVDTAAANIVVTASSTDGVMFPPGSLSVVDLSGSTWQLTATPAADRFGSAVVTISASDGVLTVTRDVTVTFNAVNDAPSFVKGADQVVPRDSAPQSVAGFASNISAGPFESSQSVSFLVSTDNPALFSVGPAIGPTGNLTYTLAPAAVGTALVTVRLQDDGGTAGGGVDSSPPQTFTLTVIDSPTLAPIADVATDEDAPVSVDLFVTAAVGSVTPPTVSVASGNTTLLPQSGLALVDLGGGHWRLTVSPAANRAGTTTVTVTAAHGTAAVSRTFILSVASLNDAPSFTKGSTVFADLSGSSVTIGGWATNISPGPNEAGQAVTFLVSVDDPSLFAVAPTIDASGALRFRGTGAPGTAVVTVRLRDDGGTTGGGIDTSAPQTFEIRFSDTVVIPSGKLDPTFDADGVRLAPSPLGAGDFARDIARQSDGKYVVAGYSVTGADNLLYVSRFNADGTLDTSFGSGGSVEVAGNTTNFVRLYAVEIAADGKIVVAGESGTGLFAARLNSDGTLDQTFGTQGRVTFVPPGSSVTTGSYTAGLALQPDGKLVIVRYYRESSASFFQTVVVRLTTLGALDTSFNGTGYLLLGYSSVGDEAPFDVAIQNDGKIVLAGRSGSLSSPDFFAARITSTGGLDSTFGVGGKAIFNVGAAGSSDTAYRLALQSDGKIVLAGASGSDFGLARLNADGSLDTSFDADGKVVTNMGATDVAFGLALQADGKIVLGGYSSSNGNEFALARYTTIGALDASFDGDGKVVVGLATTSEQIFGLLVQSDGKIVAAGAATDSVTGSDFALARLTSAGALDASFATAGVGRLNFGAGSVNAVRTIALPNGRILAAGTAGENGSSSVGRFAVWRFLADGSLDAAFGTGGIAWGALGNWTTAGMALQSDGKILVLDSAGNRVARLTAAGVLDQSFGTGGFFSFGSIFTSEASLAVQADDAILIGGYKFNSATSADEMMVVRITAGGSGFDASFDGDGQKTIDIGVDDDRANVVVVQADGRILLGGTANNGSNDDMALVRLNADGSLDTTFSADGKIVEVPSTGTDRIRTIVVQTDGRIVVGGAANNDFVLFRYLADGTLDTSFAGDGSFVLSSGSADDVYSLLLQADGKLLAVGQSTAGQAAAFRVTAAGVLDTTLDDGDGLLMFSTGGSASSGFAGTLQSDGKLVVAGTSLQDQRYELVVLRYLTQPTPAGAAPALVSVADQSVDEDGTLTLTVSASDSDTPGDWLRLAAESSTASLLANENMTVTALGGGQWSLVIRPRPNQFGSTEVTLKVSDGATIGSESFTLDVRPVNEAPSFTKGADVSGGAGATTRVGGWAKNLSAGFPNEWAQNLTFLVTAADPSLFDVLPSIDASGTLSFAAKATAAGQSTVVTVRLQDDGGTDRGGADTSAPQTFNITIGNGPLISAIADLVKPEGQTATANFSISDLDTPLGSLSITAVADNTTLVPGGILGITDLGGGNYRVNAIPAADRFGTANITVTAFDGTYTVTRTFKIDFTNVNDVPSFVKGLDQYDDAGTALRTVPFWARSITAGAQEPGQQVAFQVSVDDPSLFSVLPTISADGTLAYAAAAGKSGTATVTVTLRDDGGTADGGVDAAAPQTFTIRVLAGSSVAGDFDPTFDSDGIAAGLAPYDAFDMGRDLALQGDGKIVTVGYDQPGLSSPQVVVRRFLADGTLDASFGTGGAVRFGTSLTANAAAVDIASDGKIYVAFTSSNDFAIARLNADGSLDTGYGIAGIARAVASSTTESTVGLALQLDGRAIVVGSIANDLGAVRFNADGSLDASFGVAGFFRYTLNSASLDVLNDVIVQNDGRIVAAGYGVLPSSTTSNDWVVVRLTAAGVLDTTFSGDGLLVASNSTNSTSDQAFRIAVDGLDRIVVGGNLSGAFGVMRLNADGSFDTSFSADGFATVDPTSGTDTVTGLLLNADGTITTVGYSSSTAAPGMQVARFLSDGTLDTAIDGDGVKSIRLGDATTEIVYGAALGPDGRITAVGYAWAGPNTALALVRLLPDGMLDSSLAGDGILLNLGDRASEQLETVARAADGGYVVSGLVGFPVASFESSRLFVSRYKADGSLDTSFGSGGYAYHPANSTSTGIVVVQADGKIVVGARGSSSIGLARFNADGTIDTTFGTAGVAALPASFAAFTLALQSDGKILLGGRQSSNVAVARYNVDGTLDTSFDGDGVMNFDAGGTGETIDTISVQADGRIVLAGTASNGVDNDFFVARLNAGGTLDASFDVDGWTRTQVGANTDTAGGMVIQSDGKIVVGGDCSISSKSAWGLVRYNADGSLDTSFDGDGIATVMGLFGLTDLAIQSDGRIVAVGSATGAGNDTAVARFLSDGGLDPTFAEDGLLWAPLSPFNDSARGVVVDPDGKIVVAGYADVGGRYEGRIFRLLNDVDTAPTVAGVYVRGSAWTGSYLDYLDANGLGAATTPGLGYALAGGASQLSTTIPWNNVDRITIQFDRDVDATVDSLVLVNSSGATISATAFRYVDGRTVEFTLPTLAADKYVIHVAASTVGGIDDLALDGEWITSTSTWGQDPLDGSGEGTAGGDFNFRFNVLPGDFDSSGSVAFGEIGQARLRLGLTTLSAGYQYRQDYDGSGSITFGEIGQARGKLGSSISAFAEPPMPPGSLASQDMVTAQSIAEPNGGSEPVVESLALSSVFIASSQADGGNETVTDPDPAATSADTIESVEILSASAAWQAPATIDESNAQTSSFTADAFNAQEARDGTRFVASSLFVEPAAVVERSSISFDGLAFGALSPARFPLFTPQATFDPSAVRFAIVAPAMAAAGSMRRDFPNVPVSAVTGFQSQAWSTVRSEFRPDLPVSEAGENAAAASPFAGVSTSESPRGWHRLRRRTHGAPAGGVNNRPSSAAEADA